MRFLLTAIFLLTATQAFAEIRHRVCTVLRSDVFPKGTTMDLLYDEETASLIYHTEPFGAHDFTIFFKDAFELKAVDALATKTTVVVVGDRNCAFSRGVQYYKGEHRDIRIYTVGDFSTSTIASCPCANLD